MPHVVKQPGFTEEQKAAERARLAEEQAFTKFREETIPTLGRVEIGQAEQESRSQIEQIGRLAGGTGITGASSVEDILAASGLGNLFTSQLSESQAAQLNAAQSNLKAIQEARERQEAGGTFGADEPFFQEGGQLLFAPNVARGVEIRGGLFGAGRSEFEKTQTFRDLQTQFPGIATRVQREQEQAQEQESRRRQFPGTSTLQPVSGEIKEDIIGKTLREQQQKIDTEAAGGTDFDERQFFEVFETQGRAFRFNPSTGQLEDIGSAQTTGNEVVGVDARGRRRVIGETGKQTGISQNVVGRGERFAGPGELTAPTGRTPLPGERTGEKKAAQFAAMFPRIKASPTVKDIEKTDFRSNFDVRRREGILVRREGESNESFETRKAEFDLSKVGDALDDTTKAITKENDASMAKRASEALGGIQFRRKSENQLREEAKRNPEINKSFNQAKSAIVNKRNAIMEANIKRRVTGLRGSERAKGLARNAITNDEKDKAKKEIAESIAELRTKKKSLQDEFVENGLVNDNTILGKIAKRKGKSTAQIAKIEKEQRREDITKEYVGKINPRTGQLFTVLEAQGQADKIIQNIGKDPDAESAFSAFSDQVASGVIDTTDPSALFESARGFVGNNNDEALKLITTISSSDVAKNAQDEWLRGRGFGDIVGQSETQAQKQSAFLKGDITGVTLGDFLDQLEATKSPETFSRIMDVALSNGNLDENSELLVRARKNLADARAGVGGAALQNTLKALQENPNIYGGLGQEVRDNLIASGFIPPLGASLTENQRANLETTIIKNFDRGTQEARDAERQVRIINASFEKFKENVKAGKEIGAASEGIIVTFNKILDPSSVVRESEYARTAEGGSLISRIVGKTKAIQRGGPGVTEEVIREYVELGNTFLAGYRQDRVNLARRARRRAQNYRLDEDVIFDPETLKLLNIFDNDRQKKRDLIQKLSPQQRRKLESGGFDFGEFKELPPSPRKQGAATRPVRNFNPINIKVGGTADQFAEKNPDGSVRTDDQGHLIFGTAEDGILGGKADLRAKVEGRSRFLEENPTIAELGSVFAEDPNWPRAVASILGVDINTRTRNIDFDELFRAVARQEGGLSLISSV